jgi:hypothetical protein
MVDLTLQDELLNRGFVVLSRVFDGTQANTIAAELEGSLRLAESSVLRSRGSAYGARNLLETFPEAAELVRQPVLREFARAVLGEPAGLVRGLYFDKPPERSWSLPWHKDRTIAVKDNACSTSTSG